MATNILETTKLELQTAANNKINNDFLNAQREVMQILLTAASHFGKKSAEVSTELLDKKNSNNLSIRTWLTRAEPDGKALSISGNIVSWAN